MGTSNLFISATAGSGKTTYLVKKALELGTKRILITTFTEINKDEIQKKFIELNKFIPSNIHIQTWFSFLLQHGVRPYQNLIIKNDIRGMILVNEPSGKKGTLGGRPIYYGENSPQQFYLSPSQKIYSDKIPHFMCSCNSKSNGQVILRLSQIYDYIFIDEVQDLAGYDLEIIKNIILSSIELILVGDPRQVTYLTHFSRKYKNYQHGLIQKFLENELPRKASCTIDDTTLSVSHRNTHAICALSSSLYPQYASSTPCTCTECIVKRSAVGHTGLFTVKKEDIENYLHQHRAIQLRWNRQTLTSSITETYNFGASKGLGFDHVLIYPTEKMLSWLIDNNTAINNEVRAKLYVAITRARFSVGIVCDQTIPFFTSYSVN